MEGAAPGAPELLHVGAAAQHLAHVEAQLPDVCAAPAGHLEEPVSAVALHVVYVVYPAGSEAAADAAPERRPLEYLADEEAQGLAHMLLCGVLVGAHHADVLLA